MPISPRASEIGLPTFRASSTASSSACSRTPAARRRSRLARSPGVTARHAGKTALARATASSVSAAPACGSSAITSSVAGSTTLTLASVPTLTGNLLGARNPGRQKWHARATITLDGTQCQYKDLDRALTVTDALVDSSTTRVLLPELDRRYPVIVRADGVWVEDAAGRRYLDAMSGGSMALTLGHGRRDIIEAARAQAQRLAYVHNERLTNPPQERLARDLVEVAPEGFSHVHFVTGGSEANEAALRLARTYHVERDEPERWRVISPAQAYHGPTIATLALTGRPGLKGNLDPYIPDAALHIRSEERRVG